MAPSSDGVVLFEAPFDGRVTVYEHAGGGDFEATKVFKAPLGADADFDVAPDGAAAIMWVKLNGKLEIARN